MNSATRHCMFHIQIFAIIAASDMLYHQSVHFNRRMQIRLYTEVGLYRIFEPDRIVGQMDYSYSAEYRHDLEPEYGELITGHAGQRAHDETQQLMWPASRSLV